MDTASTEPPATPAPTQAPQAEVAWRPLTCTGQVTRSGRRVAFAEATATDNQNKIVATASGSLLIFPMP